MFFPVLFKVNLIFKDFSRQPWIFKYFSSLCEPCNGFQTGFAMLCLYACLFICALWSPAGKGLTSWLSFVVSAVSLSLSHWYPGSGVVLDCIDS